MDMHLLSTIMGYGGFGCTWSSCLLITDLSQMSWQFAWYCFGRGRSTYSIWSDPPFTHSRYTSSKWALYVVITAFVGAIGGNFVLFALVAPAYSQGMLCRLTHSACWHLNQQRVYHLVWVSIFALWTYRVVQRICYGGDPLCLPYCVLF